MCSDTLSQVEHVFPLFSIHNVFQIGMLSIGLENKKGVYPIMKKVLAVVLALALTLTMVGMAMAEGKVGVAMPTALESGWRKHEGSTRSCWLHC